MMAQAEGPAATKRNWMVWVLAFVLLVAAVWGARTVMQMNATQPLGDCFMPRPDTSYVGQTTREDCLADCPDCTWRG